MKADVEWVIPSKEMMLHDKDLRRIVRKSIKDNV